MGKKTTFFYILFSIVFFVAVAVLFALRVNDARNANIQRMSDNFSGIRKTIEATYTLEKSFDSETFKSTISQAFSNAENLNILVIYSYDTGIEYLHARQAKYLSSSITDIAAIKGVPQFTYNTFSQTKITSSMAVPQKSSFLIEGVYTVIEEKDLVPVLHNTAILLIVFAVFTAGFTLLLWTLGKSPVPSSPKPEIRKPVVSESKTEPRISPPIKPAAAPEDPQVSTSRHLFSPESGLGWQEHLEKRLSLELERAAYNEQDLSLVLMRYKNLSKTSPDYKLMAKEIQGKIAFEDLAFEYMNDGFAVVIPNSNLDQSIMTIKDFMKKIDGAIVSRYGHPCCGITSRNGRLVNGSRLLLEAGQALNRAGGSEEDCIVGFRPDPGKYRKYVSARGSSQRA